MKDINHFRGCHKVHVECANKLIDHAHKLIQEASDLAEQERGYADQYYEWLESLETKNNPCH